MLTCGQARARTNIQPLGCDIEDTTIRRSRRHTETTSATHNARTGFPHGVTTSNTDMHLSAYDMLGTKGSDNADMSSEPKHHTVNRLLAMEHNRT